MKNLCLFYIITLFISISTLTAQNCLPGSITFSSQQEIDDFSINYPGCTTIEGSVCIGDCRWPYSTVNITNLNGLSVLTNIKGNITIRNCHNLTNLDGLDNLASIGRGLSLFYNNNLHDISALSKIVEIDHNIHIHNCPNLSSLNGLNNLTSVGHSLYISNCLNLSSLNGLNNLTTVGRDLHTYNCPSLSSLNGLNNLNSVVRNLVISSLPSLSSLNGLNNLNSIGHNLYIGNNSNLNSLEDLENLNSIGNTLFIRHNSSLATCEALSICNHLDNGNYSSIYNNAPGCNSQAEIISACASMSYDCYSSGVVFSTQADIDNFPSLHPHCVEILGDLTIQESSSGAITNLDSLIQLKSIQGHLSITSNTNLSNLNGFNNLTDLSGNFSLNNNANLTSTSGLDSLSTIGGNLSIFDNNNLQNLTGLKLLSAVNGDLSISSNNNLTSFNGLSNLTDVNGIITIQNNTSLTDINALASIDSSGISELQILNNTLLSTCDIKPICDYLSDNSNPATITLNAPNCNSTNEVLQECNPAGASCLPNGIVFSNQDNINNFPSIYPGCKTILGSVEFGLDVQNFDSLQQIESIRGSFYINNSNDVQDFSGLENLDSIGSSTFIANCSSLDNIKGLSNLDYIGGEFKITGNQNLKNLDGLENLTSLGTDAVPSNKLRIASNQSLTNIEGLSGLTDLPMELHIHENNSLKNLKGLHNIATIQGETIISENDSLQSLQGLEGLTALTGSTVGNRLLRIYDNDQLSSSCGIGNLDGTTIGFLDIRENAILSACESQTICGFLDTNPHPSQYSIYSNSPGCNSAGEIFSKCNDPYINTWIGPSDQGWFESASNWSLGHFPMECENVHIPNGVTVNFDTGTNTVINSLTIENGGHINVMLGSEIIVIQNQ